MDCSGGGDVHLSGVLDLVPVDATEFSLEGGLEFLNIVLVGLDELLDLVLVCFEPGNDSRLVLFESGKDFLLVVLHELGGALGGNGVPVDAVEVFEGDLISLGEVGGLGGALFSNGEAVLDGLLEFLLGDIEGLTGLLKEILALLSGNAELLSSVVEDLVELLLGDLVVAAEIHGEGVDVVLVEGSGDLGSLDGSGDVIGINTVLSSPVDGSSEVLAFHGGGDVLHGALEVGGSVVTGLGLGQGILNIEGGGNFGGLSELDGVGGSDEGNGGKSLEHFFESCLGVVVVLF